MREVARMREAAAARRVLMKTMAVNQGASWRAVPVVRNVTEKYAVW